MNKLSIEARAGIAVLKLDNPPVNSLGHELREALVAGLERANADPSIEAIVLIGSGAGFSGGADIREFGTPKAIGLSKPATVIREIEEAPKPVIAAIGGVCMGGGLELALACHYRVGVPGARIALPEVKLGLLPGAGGTQRLPRLLGVESRPQHDRLRRDRRLGETARHAAVRCFRRRGFAAKAPCDSRARVIAEKMALKRVRDLQD